MELKSRHKRDLFIAWYLILAAVLSWIYGVGFLVWWVIDDEAWAFGGSLVVLALAFILTSFGVSMRGNAQKLERQTRTSHRKPAGDGLGGERLRNHRQRLH